MVQVSLGLSKIVVTWYDRDGKFHRSDGGPALMCYSLTSKLYALTWYKHGKKHNLRGPALIMYYCILGTREREVWYEDDVLFYAVTYRGNGSVDTEFNHDVKPAYIVYN